MIISITNASRETAVVAFGIILTITITAHGAIRKALFPLEVTNELKGLAILMIILSHIGYFLVSDRQFLAPLSNYAGIGVDLFLALSGFGLVVSALRKPLSVGQFYLKRLPRIYLPMILTLLIFLILDAFFLHQTYPLKTTLMNLFGIFPRADLYNDIDSPMWFITFLLVNYLLFPFIFRRRFPALSALAMTIAVLLFDLGITRLNLLSPNLNQFYKLHFLSFPLGMFIAAILNQPPAWLKMTAENLHSKIKHPYALTILRLIGLVLAGFTLYYFYYHSQVGRGWQLEAAASLANVVAILVIFILKKVDFGALALFGTFSFEIYLLHWPLLWRYNFLFGRLPAGVATLIYLGIFIGLGYLFKNLINKILHITKYCNIYKKNT